MKLNRIGWGALAALCMMMLSPAMAEVTLDGSLGTAGEIDGPDYDITAEMGRRSGENLFHSFGRFSIGPDETAIFSGPDTIEAIIGRVTGGEVSRIDGTLYSDIYGADLFLLNPAGVIFGSDAFLDLTGSFHVSTADFLQLGLSDRFYALPSPDDILSAAPPAAFGFLDGDAGRIVVDGDLQVGWGETLAVAGGDVDINGSLMAEEGVVQVESRGAGALAPLLPDGFDADAPPVANGGTASLSGFLDVSGDGAGSVFIRAGRFYSAGGGIFAETYWDLDGGVVDIQAGSVDLADGSLISGQTHDYGRGADVRITAAETISLSGADAFGGAGLISAITELQEEGAGDAGNIRLAAADILIANGGWVTASSTGDGAGGDVTLIAEKTIRLSGNDENGRGSRIESSGQSAYSGPAGDIRIEAADVELADGALIDSSAFGIGDGGDIAMRVDRSVMVSGFGGNGQGSGVIARSDSPTASAGNIAISPGTDGGAVSIDFRDGGWIGNTADGAGPGGNVTVDAGGGTIHLSGADADGYASRIYTTALDDGDAGNIVLKGRDIRFSDGAGVTASTEGRGNAGRIEVTAGHLELSGANPYGENKDGFGSGIYARTRTADAGDDAARGGEVVVKVGSLVIRDGALISSNTEGSGAGGAIDVTAGELSIYGDGSGSITEPPAESQQEWRETHPPRAESDYVSGIYASSEKTDGAAGDAGGVIVDAVRINLTDRGQITTAAENAGGGAMEIAVKDTLFMLNGRITTSVQFGKGNGGDITISEPEFVILNHSDIIAQAYEGQGGNIRIVTDQFIQSADSIVDASSKLGIDGNIEIISPEADLSKVLTVLSTDYLDAAQWMETPCEARSGEDVSRFVITGRDGAPPPCDGILGSPVSLPGLKGRGGVK